MAEKVRVAESTHLSSRSFHKSCFQALKLTILRACLNEFDYSCRFLFLWAPITIDYSQGCSMFHVIGSVETYVLCSHGSPKLDRAAAEHGTKCLRTQNGSTGWTRGWPCYSDCVSRLDVSCTAFTSSGRSSRIEFGPGVVARGTRSLPCCACEAWALAIHFLLRMWKQAFLLRRDFLMAVCISSRAQRFHVHEIIEKLSMWVVNH